MITQHSSSRRLPPRTLLERLRRGKRSRGAALVEAVVAVPFFILIFAGLVYVGKLYGEKQKTMRLAKQQVWTEALSNCKGGSTPDGSGDASVDMGEGADYQGDAGGSEVTRDFGSTSATVTSSVKADPILGGFTNQLKTKTKLQCNEQPYDGNILGALKFGWRAVRFW